MKKGIIVLGIALICLLSACSATTITQHEGNYIYSANEDIRIFDIDTRDVVGVLNVTGIQVLNNRPFTIKETTGFDENGNELQEDIVYEQLVQVFYHYDSPMNKAVSAANFQVYDQAGVCGTINPKVKDTALPSKDGSCFIVALKNKSEFVDMKFRYNILQTTHTAKIQLSVSALSDTPSSDGTVDSSSSSGQNTADSMQTKMAILYVIIGMLSAAVIMLIIIVAVQSHHRH